MENEIQDVDLNNEQGVEESEVKTEETKTEEKKEEKPQETLEARRARLERELKQVSKKLGIETEKPTKSEKIDYAQEAYLVAHGIKEADERELLNDRVANTGKSLKEVMENKYFQQDLQELRTSKATKLATPSSSSRSNTSARDTVDYWKAKIDSGSATLLDVPDIKLRRQIVDSKIAQVKEVNHFTNNPFGTIDIYK